MANVVEVVGLSKLPKKLHTAIALKGTGLSPYINSAKGTWALALEGNRSIHPIPTRIYSFIDLS
jgi:hypothetical protein